MMVKFHALAAFGMLSLAGQAFAQSLLQGQTVKVMPFGASIVTRCWRTNLFQKLQKAGVTNVDFVGSQQGPAECLTQFPGTDNDHEGHPGSQATDYAAKGNLTTWLNQQPTVDVVIMFLGHNDIILGHKPQNDIKKAYDTLISQMRQKNPNVQIVWGNLTPVDPKRWTSDNAQGIASLAAMIKDYAPSKSTAASPVRFVDTFDGYDPVADTDDGEHPNSSGNEKMATKFFSATKDAIQAASKVTTKKMKNQNVGSDFVKVVQDFLDDDKDIK